MKRVLSVLMAALLLFAGLTACGSETVPDSSKSHTLQIVTTIFPEYDWVENILGENPAKASVTLLSDKGTDLHSYQPTVADMIKISSCDLFIYIGGESDIWVEDALKEATNKEMVVVNLLDVLGEQARKEEIAEGMKTQDDQEEEAYDEHIWLSLQNATFLCEEITEAIVSVDPEHEEIYRNQLLDYKKKLEALDEDYEKVVENASVKTLLFGDRFPFRYLTEDYGLTYDAAFPGCSSETEASFETITFLAQKMDDLSLPAILTTEGSDQKIAQTILQNTKDPDRKILTLDSMQSVTKKEIESGTTYLSIMESNLDVLKNALE